MLMFTTLAKVTQGSRVGVVKRIITLVLKYMSKGTQLLNIKVLLSISVSILTAHVRAVDRQVNQKEKAVH